MAFEHTLSTINLTFNLVKKKTNVTITGDGGDELFFGYERFISIAKNHWLWKQPYLIRYFVRGMDKFFLDEKYVNDCIKSTYVSPFGKYLILFEKKIKNFNKKPYR